MTIELLDDELIPDAELASQWGCTRRTLTRYESEADGLPYVIVAGRKFRPRKACQAWLAKRVRLPNPRRGRA
jgi:hypothetical protein